MVILPLVFPPARKMWYIFKQVQIASTGPLLDYN
jgi:hypothetical protein